MAEDTHMEASGFEELRHPPLASPIRELGLTIKGSSLEPLLTEFEKELVQAGIRRLRPRFYLSTEWGVSEGTIAIAIPFYLASPELTALHVERVGHVEGVGPADILRYFRHEMGHVVNYAYRLFETEEWIERFGPINRPYLEEYKIEPFSRQYVRHLPGWYAQKHPDEDWSETFAVWMTPGLDWRTEYSDWPVALAKLQYCDRTMAALSDLEPRETAIEFDEDVSELTLSIEDYYAAGAMDLDATLPPGIDAVLRTIFEDVGVHESVPSLAARRKASELVCRLERDLLDQVYRWTGHFPERTRSLLRLVADHADTLDLVYPEDKEATVIVALTTLITTLAMNYVQRGTYVGNGGDSPHRVDPA
jgi:hypothetical protein